MTDLSKEFEKNKIRYEIIAVNNGSIDRTPEIITRLSKKKPAIKKVDITKNIGYGNGILAGLEATTGDAVGWGWGDNQTYSSDFVNVFNNLKSRQLDICKTYRLNRGEPIARKIFSAAYNKMFLLFLINTKDMDGCPKIMRREVYETLNLQERKWFIDPELIIKARWKNYRVGEMPVRYKKRLKGKSKVNWSVVFEMFKNILRYRFT